MTSPKIRTTIKDTPMSTINTHHAAPVLIYRPELREVAGSVTAAILLSQVAYWWDKSDGEFYKFKEPCDNPKYLKGGSWCEELGFTPKEFSTAEKKLIQSGLISKRLTVERLSYYRIDKRLLSIKMKSSSKTGLSRKARDGDIYFLREKSEGHIKIGRALSFEKRLSTFSVKLPFHINPEHVFRCQDYISSEKKLHDFFSNYRVDGEWFCLSDEDLEMVKDCRFLDQIGIEVIS